MQVNDSTGYMQYSPASDKHRNQNTHIETRHRFCRVRVHFSNRWVLSLFKSRCHHKPQFRNVPSLISTLRQHPSRAADPLETTFCTMLRNQIQAETSIDLQVHMHNSQTIFGRYSWEMTSASAARRLTCTKNQVKMISRQLSWYEHEPVISQKYANAP